VVGAINASIDGNHENLLDLLEGVSGLPELKEGEQSPVDKATLLFISILDWQDDGGAPRALDGGHSRERLGRFPSNDGNAVEYLLEFTGEGEGGSGLHSLLKKLGRGFGDGTLGHNGFGEGSMGIELLGWLDSADVNELRKEIERGRWMVKSDEPLDGGVQDAFRHLLVFLRSASRRKCGILMRGHS
jgi:hypothetical protein